MALFTSFHEPGRGEDVRHVGDVVCVEADKGADVNVSDPSLLWEWHEACRQGGHHFSGSKRQAEDLHVGISINLVSLGKVSLGRLSSR
jgi:hypothetical protein